MSRRSRTRHRRRKARRQAIREGRAPLPKPSLPLRPEDHLLIWPAVQGRAVGGPAGQHRHLARVVHFEVGAIVGIVGVLARVEEAYHPGQYFIGD